MISLRSLTTATALAISLATPANAWTLYGAGNSSCRTWLADMSNQEWHAEEVQWVLGYVAGAGSSHTPLKDSDAAAMESLISTACAGTGSGFIASSGRSPRASH
jgi:hypothetical protein